MQPEIRQERGSVRIIAGILGVLALAGGLLVVVFDHTLWQAWGSALIMAPLFLYAAIVGRAPSFLESHTVSSSVREDAEGRLQEHSVQWMAWWQRLGMGLMLGTLIGAIEVLFSGSWREGLLGWALPFGLLIGMTLLLAPMVESSRIRVVLTGLIAGAAAGILSWALVHRAEDIAVWWPMAVGSLLGVVVVWTELKFGVATKETFDFDYAQHPER